MGSLVIFALSPPVWASQADGANRAAAAVIEGVLRRDYRNVRPQAAEAIVPIEVRRSELGAAA